MRSSTPKPAVTHGIAEPIPSAPSNERLTLSLKRSPGSNPYCVPAAIALLTDLHVDQVVELIKQEVGEQPIAGIFYPLALKILLKLGYQFEEIHNSSNFKYFTYSEFMFLCCFKSHVGVWYAGKFYDNQNPTGTNRGTPRMRIEKIFRVWKESCS